MDAMQSLKEVRRQNLNLIVSSLGGHGAQKVLAVKSGIDQTYLSNIRTGNREMGEGIARKIEAALRYEMGWMDRAHSTVQNEQGTDAKTATPEDTALEQRLLALWAQLPAARRLIALEVLEDMIVAAQVRSAASAPMQSPLL
ncbi:MAG: hypothetical protein QG599_2992 [Pseudomonadota bacterium]|nr:hypothetical protein [Pseudomonadota bacterium]